MIGSYSFRVPFVYVEHKRHILGSLYRSPITCCAMPNVRSDGLLKQAGRIGRLTAFDGSLFVMSDTV